MTDKKKCDVIGLSYYLLFYAKRQHVEMNIYSLQNLLVALQEHHINHYHSLLFHGNMTIQYDGRLSIAEVEKEFEHYGSYPIQSRVTLKRLLMAREARSCLPDDCLETVLSTYEDEPKAKQFAYARPHRQNSIQKR